MEPIIVAYLILGAVMVFAMIIVILKIAGKDMFFAFARFFNPRGCEIQVIDSNRQIARYYKNEKDGVFTIEGKPYITNPNKLLNVDDEMVKDVQKAMDLKLQRLNHSINKLEVKKDIVFKQIQSLKDDKNSYQLLEQLKLNFVDLDNRIELLESKKKAREQAYFSNRRGLYLYVKDDPIPKDLHEFYTEMDSVQLENVILRAQTKDPKGVMNMEQALSWIKKFVAIACIIGAIGAWFAFQNHGQIQQIAEQAGYTLVL